LVVVLSACGERQPRRPLVVPSERPRRLGRDDRFHARAQAAFAALAHTRLAARQPLMFVNQPVRLPSLEVVLG
jgi:hypothetical protein